VVCALPRGNETGPKSGRAFVVRGAPSLRIAVRRRAARVRPDPVVPEPSREVALLLLPQRKARGLAVTLKLARREGAPALYRPRTPIAEGSLPKLTVQKLL
jgi:hypothetical protein